MSDYILKQSASEVQTAINLALNPDTTLTVPGNLADAKAVGDAIKASIKPSDEQINAFIRMWLDEHPEATTTVGDGAITTEKLADGSVTADKLADDIVLSGGGNTEALNVIFNILQRGVFTENVNSMMVRLWEAIESGGSGDNTGGDNTGGNDPEDETYCFITNNLTNVFSNNVTSVVPKGVPYSTYLYADDGFTLTNVTVTMGGVDITETAYSKGVVGSEGSNYDGYINIANVTGNIKITAVAKGVVVENLTPFWTKDFNNTTFEYTVTTGTHSGSPIYAQDILFRSTVGGGTLYVTVDPAYLNYARFQLFIYDKDGNAYKIIEVPSSTNNFVSGVISNFALLEPGCNSYIYTNGSWSFDIPDECTVMLRAGGFDADNIADETIASASKPVYAMVDAITFDGVGITAKVVKEV